MTSLNTPAKVDPSAPDRAGSIISRCRAVVVARGTSALEKGVLFVAAALLIASGLIHLYLWHVAYRHVATLGPLFLVQTVSTIIVAGLLAVMGRGILVVAGLVLMVGTIIGFILVTTVGLFGFTLEFISGWAKLALVVEICAIIALGVEAAMLWRTTKSPSKFNIGE